MQPSGLKCHPYIQQKGHVVSKQNTHNRKKMSTPSQEPTPVQETTSTATFVDIKQAYVDEKLREFFQKEGREVNIDNICLFAAKTVSEYNTISEIKLKGRQKLEAATELARSVIEKTVAFVSEDKRREVVKNIYHNINTIETTIQFIVDISNDPNIVKPGKWILDTSKKVKETVDETDKKSGGLITKLKACLFKPKPAKEEEEKKPEEEPVKKTEDVEEEVKVEEVKVEETKPGNFVPKLSVEIVHRQEVSKFGNCVISISSGSTS